MPYDYDTLKIESESPLWEDAPPADRQAKQPKSSRWPERGVLYCPILAVIVALATANLNPQGAEVYMVFAWCLMALGVVCSAIAAHRIAAPIVARPPSRPRQIGQALLTVWIFLIFVGFQAMVACCGYYLGCAMIMLNFSIH